MLLKHYIEYSLLKSTIILFKIIPCRLAFTIITILALISFIILTKRRKITLENIKIAFPEKSLFERSIIATKSYINLAKTITYNLLILSGRINSKKILNSLNNVDYLEFKRSAEDLNKKMLLITGHIGNWELIPQFLSLTVDNKIHVIAREGSNLLIENKIIKPLRNKFGINVFYKRNALLNMVKALKKGHITGILIDQNLNDSMHIKAPFFDKDAKCTPVPAILQSRYEAEVWPIFIIHKKFGEFKLIIQKPILFNTSSSSENDVFNLTKKHQEAIEKIIRKYPDQWFWMHNRWNLKEI